MASGHPRRSTWRQSTAATLATLIVSSLPTYAAGQTQADKVSNPPAQTGQAAPTNVDAKPGSSPDPGVAPSAPNPKAAEAAAVFRAAERAVSTWRNEATESLNAGRQPAAAQSPGAPQNIARCVKLNNYWCIKKAGWNGEIASDPEGHVAFASAVDGAAVAALLLRRYYLDFHRRSALAIISRWAPARCGSVATGPARPFHSIKTLAPNGLAGTLRARWLAGHSRGFVIARPGAAALRHTTVADRVSRPMPAPIIALGLGETDRPIKPITLDALLQSSPGAPPSRSLIGLPRVGRSSVLAGGETLGADGSVTSCGADGSRVASYAAAAAAGIKPGPDGDLALFSTDGKPTANLATLMANMARVEIGAPGPKSALISAGIAAAFRPERNPGR